MEKTGRSRVHRGLAVAAGAFGAMTLVASSSVLAGVGRDMAGDVVPFVLWANLLLSFVYMFVAVLLWRQSVWARPFAIAIAAATALVAVAFAGVALAGAPVEPRTAGALAFRILLWLGIGALAPGRAR